MQVDNLISFTARRASFPILISFFNMLRIYFWPHKQSQCNIIVNNFKKIREEKKIWTVGKFHGKLFAFLIVQKSSSSVGLLTSEVVCWIFIYFSRVYVASTRLGLIHTTLDSKTSHQHETWNFAMLAWSNTFSPLQLSLIHTSSPH